MIKPLAVKRYNQSKWLLIFLGILGQTASAQDQVLFESIGVRQGLPDNRANTIVQDKRGFIWVGTANGCFAVRCAPTFVPSTTFKNF